MTAATLAEARPRPPSAVPAAPAATPGTNARPGWPGWLPEASLALLLAVSALAFGRVYRGGGWEGAVLAPTLAAVAVVAATRRLVRPRPLAMVLDVVLVVLVVVWTVLPGSTTAGLPLVHTWQGVARLLSGFGRQFDSAVPPVDPTRAFLLLTAGGVGATGLAAAWLLAGQGRRGRASAPVPAVVVFLASCVLGAPSGRVLVVALEVLALGVHLLVERAAERADPSQWVSGTTAPGLRRPGRVGLRIVVLAAVGAVVVAALPGPDGHGVLGWKTIGQAGPTRIIVSPMVSISTRLVDNARADVFTVRSSAPAYWQLTTLDDYSGSTWQASRASYESIDGPLPTGGSQAAPRGTRVVVEHFHIQALDSPWLPSAFEPVSIRGASGVQYNQETGSILSKRSTADGETYTVTALEVLATLDAKKLEGAPALGHSDPPPDSTELPASVPRAVRALAHQIVAQAHAHNEYAEALALQDYFYGPEFTYSLDPPVDGSGVDAIDTFLFQTRTGYCQQFAGSFAVLARSIGLPTRLAVGFTTGNPIGHDLYQVTDADVHTWPEVWFPHYGWIPFEPTKGTPGDGFAIPGAAAVTGNTSRISPSIEGSTLPNPNRVTVPTAPVGAGAPGAASGSVTRSALGSSGADRRHPEGAPSAPAPARHRPTHAGSARSSGAPARSRPLRPATSNLAWVLEVLIGAAAAAASLAVANRCAAALRHRWRGRRARAAGPASAEAAWLHWQELTESLATLGIRRKAWETAPSFGARAGSALDPSGRTAQQLAAAGVAMDTVSWSDPRLRPDAPDLAAVTAEVRRLVVRRRRVRDRLRVAFDPRLSWRSPRDHHDGRVPVGGPSRAAGGRPPAAPARANKPVGASGWARGA